MKNELADLFNRVLPEAWLFRVREHETTKLEIMVYDPGSKLFNCCIMPDSAKRDYVERALNVLVHGIEARAELERNVAKRGVIFDDLTLGSNWRDGNGNCVRVLGLDSDAGVVKYKLDDNQWILSPDDYQSTNDVSNWKLY